jgi:hypothetical protein
MSSVKDLNFFKYVNAIGSSNPQFGRVQQSPYLRNVAILSSIMAHDTLMDATAKLWRPPHSPAEYSRIASKVLPFSEI